MNKIIVATAAIIISFFLLANEASAAAYINHTNENQSLVLFLSNPPQDARSIEVIGEGQVGITYLYRAGSGRSIPGDKTLPFFGSTSETVDRTVRISIQNITPGTKITEVRVYRNTTRTGLIESFTSFESPISNIPIAPTSVEAVAGDGEVFLIWNSVNKATTYNVYRDDVLIDTTTSTNYTDTYVTNDVTYSYSVTASNAEGESHKSTSVQATPKKTVVIPPISLISTEQDTSVELSWDHTDESNISGFNIYRDNVKINASLVTTKNYIDTGLASETEYTYTVTAVDNNNNESDHSDPITVTTLKEIDTTPPATPIGLKATPYNAAVTLTWDANKEGDLAGYNVYVDGQKVNTSVIKNTKYTIKGLNNDQQYEFHITAVDTSDNESTTSNTVSAMPLASLQDPIDFEGLNFPFSVFDMLKVTFSYIALFAPWILLGLAVFFSPEIAEFIKKSVRKQKGRYR